MIQPTHQSNRPFTQVMTRPRLDRVMDHALGANLIVIGAARGWGKRTLARDYLARRGLPVHWLELSRKEDQPPAARVRAVLQKAQRRSGPQVVVLEDVPADTEQDLARLAVQGIGTPPPWIKVLVLVNRCLTGERLGLALPLQTAAIGQRELAFTPEEISAYFQQVDICLDQPALAKLTACTCGMAAAIEAICQVHSAHNGWEPHYGQKVRQQLQPLFAWDLWRRTDARELLIDMALAGRFTPQMLSCLHPEPGTAERLEDLMLSGHLMPQPDPPWIALQPQARSFILDQPRSQPDGPRRARIARWHLQQGQAALALSCGLPAQDPALLGEIAERLIADQLDLDTFQTLCDALRSVPEPLARRDPRICLAMCFLETMNGCPRSALKWQQWLQACCQEDPCAENRLRLRCARMTTAPDDVALFHEFTACLKERSPLRSDLILRQYSYMLHGTIGLPHWQRHAPLLKELFAEHIYALFGPMAEGMGNFWISQHHYEIDQLSQSLAEIASACAQCETQHYHQVHTAIHLHLSRVLCAYGSLSESVSLVDRLIEQAQGHPLPPAVEPLRIHYALLAGDQARLAQWMAQRAPQDAAPIHVLSADALTVKARVYLSQDQPDKALVLLTRLSSFHQVAQRVLPYIQTRLLLAACLDRLNESGLAEQALEAALCAGYRFGYVRVFADEGALTLELLSRYPAACVPPAYRAALVRSAQRFAEQYPAYGRAPQRPRVHLTPAQGKVLALLAQGLSNQQISQALDIRLPTVKNHASRIYAKLGVRSRSAAVNTAKELGLLS